MLRVPMPSVRSLTTVANLRRTLQTPAQDQKSKLGGNVAKPDVDSLPNPSISSTVGVVDMSILHKMGASDFKSVQAELRGNHVCLLIERPGQRPIQRCQQVTFSSLVQPIAKAKGLAPEVTIRSEALLKHEPLAVFTVSGSYWFRFGDHRIRTQWEQVEL